MAVDWDNEEQIRRVVLESTVRGVWRATSHLESEMLRLIMRTSKSGRWYRRRGINHQASAPGEPPASDTGRLVGSFSTAVDESKGHTIRGVIFVRAEYAAYLEYGTRNMEPRPFARLAIASQTDEVFRIIGQEIEYGLTHA